MKLTKQGTTRSQASSKQVLQQSKHQEMRAGIECYQQRWEGRDIKTALQGKAQEAWGLMKWVCEGVRKKRNMTGGLRHPETGSWYH